jgi:hypothetical protein
MQMASKLLEIGRVYIVSGYGHISRLMMYSLYRMLANRKVHSGCLCLGRNYARNRVKYLLYEVLVCTIYNSS